MDLLQSDGSNATKETGLFTNEELIEEKIVEEEVQIQDNLRGRNEDIPEQFFNFDKLVSQNLAMLDLVDTPH